MASKLPKRIKDVISDKLSRLFDSIKSKFLSKDGGAPSVYIESARKSGGVPDKEVLDELVDTSSKYIEALKLQSTNKTQKLIEGYLKANEAPQAAKIEELLRESWVDVTSKLENIVNTETTAYRNMGSLEGVIRVSSVYKIKDPTVVFITSGDKEVCEECKKVHIFNGQPRAWKLSEVSHAYHKKGNDEPSIYGIHPRCRCSMITILPGYGYKNGKLQFVDVDYSYFDDQNS